MPAGNSSQQNFRKAIGAIKDTTMVGMAKVNNEFKALDVAILKATNHVEVLPKEKHVRTILGAVSGSRPRADVAYCIHTLARRLAKTRTWVVALKTLIIIHRALREVDQSFCEELICYNNSRGHMLNLQHFKDETSPSAWDNSTWIRSYALYLEECLECFHALKYDFYRDHTRTKKFDTPDLLDKLPAMQQLLFRLLACQPGGSSRYNFIIQYALSIVATESARLYVAITDGVLTLLDKFFEMQRREAVRALEIYRKSGDQAERLSAFFEVCRSLEFGRRQKYVKIEQLPPSFLTTMEEYVKDAPQTLMLQWKPNDDESSIIPEAVVDSEVNLEADPKEISDNQKSENGDGESLIPDLLSWDDPPQEASELNENNSLGPSLIAPEDSSNPTTSSEPTGWELALATTSLDSTSVAQGKVDLLDRSTLDRLYELALVRPDPITTNHTATTSSNPFEAGYSNTIREEMGSYHPSQMEHQPQYQQLGYAVGPAWVGIPQHQQASFVALTEQSTVNIHDYNMQSALNPPDYVQMEGIIEKGGSTTNPFDDAMFINKDDSLSPLQNEQHILPGTETTTQPLKSPDFSLI